MEYVPREICEREKVLEIDGRASISRGLFRRELLMAMINIFQRRNIFRMWVHNDWIRAFKVRSFASEPAHFHSRTPSDDLALARL